MYQLRAFFERVRFVEICIEKIMADVWWRQSAATRAPHCHNLTPRDEMVHIVLQSIFIQAKLPQTFSACYMCVIGQSMHIYKKK